MSSLQMISYHPFTPLLDTLMFCMSDNTEYYDLSNTWLVIHGHVWSGMVTHHQSGTDLLQGSLDNRPGQSGTRELIRGTPRLYTQTQ